MRGQDQRELCGAAQQVHACQRPIAHVIRLGVRLAKVDAVQSWLVAAGLPPENAGLAARERETHTTNLMPGIIGIEPPRRIINIFGTNP